MDSTAVTFLSVFATWILFEHSVVGQECKHVQPNFVFVGFPVPWYSPSRDVREKILPKIESADDDEETPAFRDVLSNFQSQTLKRIEPPDNRRLFESLGLGYEEPQETQFDQRGLSSQRRFSENMYPYENNYATDNFWSRFSPYMPPEYQPPMYNDEWNVPQSLPMNDPLLLANSWGYPEEQKLRKAGPRENLSINKVDNHPNWRFVDREVCGESLADRIIGGTEAALGQYPWLALLGFKNGTHFGSKTTFSCGGALITSCWVASAAHCITDLPAGYYVSVIRLGEHNLNTKVDCDSDVCAEPVQDFVPVQLIAHEEFNNPKLKNDISLIKLNQPAVISRWVQPICLPYGNILSHKLMNKIGEVAGWGVENIETLQTSKILQTIKLPVRPLDSCRTVYKKKAHIDDHQFCVGGAVGFDSCNGDSGGPFMKVDVANGSTPKYFLYGIVSFGAAKCGKKPTPGVYTRVAKYMTWVLDHLTEC